METELKLITLKEMMALLGLTKTRQWEQLRDGLLPQPVCMGRRTLYVYHEIQEIIKHRIKGESDEQIKQLVIELTEKRGEL